MEIYIIIMICIGLLAIGGIVTGIIVSIKQENNSSDIASLKQTTLASTTHIGAIETWSGIIVNKSPKDVDGVEHTNWKICDGSTYTTDAGNKITTPDLRGRFVLGHDGQAPLTNRNIGTTGGAETHTLTTEEMPSHRHNLTDDENNQFYALNFQNLIADPNVGRYPIGAEYDDETGIQRTQVEGGDQAHNNMPPFYALAYIMRIN